MGSHVEGIQIGNKVAYAAQGHAELATPSINHDDSARSLRQQAAYLPH